MRHPSPSSTFGEDSLPQREQPAHRTRRLSTATELREAENGSRASVPREGEDRPGEGVEARLEMSAPEGVPGRHPTAVTAGADTENTEQLPKSQASKMNHQRFFLFFYIYLLFVLPCFFSFRRNILLFEVLHVTCLNIKS